METIKEAISGLLKKLPELNKKVRDYGCLSDWASRVETSGNSWAERLSAGTLHIVTESPAQGQDIMLGKNGFIRKMNDIIGSEEIKDIKVRIGTRKEPRGKG